MAEKLLDNSPAGAGLREGNAPRVVEPCNTRRDVLCEAPWDAHPVEERRDMLKEEVRRTCLLEQLCICIKHLCLACAADVRVGGPGCFARHLKGDSVRLRQMSYVLVLHAQPTLHWNAFSVLYPSCSILLDPHSPGSPLLYLPLPSQNFRFCLASYHLLLHTSIAFDTPLSCQLPTFLYAYFVPIAISIYPPLAASNSVLSVYPCPPRIVLIYQSLPPFHEYFAAPKLPPKITAQNCRPNFKVDLPCKIGCQKFVFNACHLAPAPDMTHDN